MSLATDSNFFELLVGSYRRLVGAEPDFLAGEARSAEWLYEDAAYCVVAHNTDPDPRFIYANRAAQACFEYDWDVFTSLPSRFSAEEGARAERARLLEKVAGKGFALNYRGLRIAKSGRRFLIEDGVIWNLVDRDGILHGQAAAFRTWRDV